MRDFLQSVRFKILVGLLSLLAGFMLMAIYSGGSATIAGEALSLITVPIQRASASVSGSVAGFFEKFLSAGEVYEQNQLLREEVNRLRARVADYDRARHENEQFREILGVMENRRDLTVQPASVIARDPSERFYSFTIDKGTLDNISYLDPVMTADGLVGYVSEVGMTYAKVITILDVTMNVGAHGEGRRTLDVYDTATREIGIVTGSIAHAAQGLSRMEFLPRDSRIEPGNLIFTSGGSLFPPDILIGTVTEVVPNDHGTSLMAIIRPAADIPSIRNVFVITHFDGQEER